MNIEQARFNMVEQQIRPWNVFDSRVLELLSVMRREDFVPDAQRALAFADMEIVLQGTPEQARASGQTMLPPRLEARMLQDLNPRRHEKVLEIGTGSGFMAALLAHRAQQVLTLEIDPALARQARLNLQRAGIHNAQVQDVTPEDWMSAVKGPYDAIMLSGSVAEVPPELLAALKVGGRLMAIIGQEPVMRASLLTKTGQASFTSSQGWDTLAPRLQGFAEPARFRF